MKNLILFFERVGAALDRGERVQIEGLLTFARKDGTDVMLGKALRSWINNEGPAPTDLSESSCTDGLDTTALLGELLHWLEPIRSAATNTEVVTSTGRFWSDCNPGYDSINPQTGQKIQVKPVKVVYGRIS